MTQVSELTEQGLISKELPKQSNLNVGIDVRQDAAQEPLRPQKVNGEGPRRGAVRPAAERVSAPPVSRKYAVLHLKREVPQADAVTVTPVNLRSSPWRTN